MEATEQAIAPVETISQIIYVLRGHKVILDADLARLYGVSTTRLNQQVRRNMERFPEDFAFQLSGPEFEALMLQNATSNVGRGGRRKRPLAYTEHGALMAASVLNTPRAVEVGIYVVRAFVRLRGILSTHVELAAKLEELERRLDRHDEQIVIIIETIRQLMAPPETPERRIGFAVDELRGY